jgi:integrase
MDNSKAVEQRNPESAPAKRKRRIAKVRPNLGSVREKNSAWYWEYYVEGKHKMERLGSSKEGDSDFLKNKQAAVDEANRRLAQRGDRNNQKGSSRSATIQITEFWRNVYLPKYVKELRPSTIHGYCQMWAQHLEPHFGKRRLCDYEPYMASEFLTSLARDGKHSKNTISHVRGLMSGIFDYAVGAGYVKWNPIAGARILVKKVAKATEETKVYSESEMQAILVALDSDEHARDHAIMSLAFFGVRKAEIMGAKWEDVDWLAGSLHVQRTAWRNFVNADGAKNENSIRKAWLGKTAVESLKRWRRISCAENTFIFQTKTGTPLELGTYSSAVLRPKFERLGLVWKAFHAGRRSSVTESRRFGKPEDLAFQFGHTIEVANDAYDKGREDRTRNAMLEYDSMLSAKLKDSIADNSGQKIQ